MSKLQLRHNMHGDSSIKYLFILFLTIFFFACFDNPSRPDDFNKFHKYDGRPDFGWCKIKLGWCKEGEGFEYWQQ